MPGTLHQGLLLLLEDDPWLAFDLLGVERPVAGPLIDRRSEVERTGADTWSIRSGYPDLVLVCRDAARGVVITIEVQKDHDGGKRWMIPVYQSHLAERHRLDTWVVVVSLDRRFSLALRSWRDGGPPRLDALLLDVDTLSASAWAESAVTRPTAAVLAGALLGYAGDLDAARIGFQAAQRTGTRAHRHGLTVLAALPKPQRDQLIGELPMNDQDSWMDVERRSGTFSFGREEGLRAGLQAGRQEGLQAGLQAGRQEGLQAGLQAGRQEGLQALRDLLFEILDERSITIDATSEAQLRGCDDLAVLQRWVRRSMHVATVEDLVADE